MNFDLIGIIYIAIVVLFFIIGYAKGLIRTLVSLFKGFLCLIPAFLLSMPVAKWVAPTKVGNFFSDIYINKFFTADVYQQIITQDNKDEVISSCIEANTKLPNFINDFLAKIVGKVVNVSTTDQKAAQVFAYVLTLYTLAVIAFIVIVILVKIVLALLKKINDAINKKKVIGTANRILGAVVNVVAGVFLVCVISYGLTFFAGLSTNFGAWLDKTTKIGEDTFTISKFVYNHNFIGYLVTWVQTKFF